jgi:hypothetical protein
VADDGPHAVAESLDVIRRIDAPARYGRDCGEQEGGGEPTWCDHEARSGAVGES